jgi:1-phosphatidylinositol-4-phosphate 5-kinase
MQELTSAGKSGSFFYYTIDSMFMLKTISSNEFNQLKSILKKYYYHLCNSKQDTFLIK